MDSKREQAFVGLFVMVAVAILVATVIALSGAFATSTTRYKAYFTFAGGLEQGSGVRYAGSPKVGRIESVRIDPQDPSRMEIDFNRCARSSNTATTNAPTAIAIQAIFFPVIQHLLYLDAERSAHASTKDSD